MEISRAGEASGIALREPGFYTVRALVIQGRGNHFKGGGNAPEGRGNAPESGGKASEGGGI